MTRPTGRLERRFPKPLGRSGIVISVPSVAQLPTSSWWAEPLDWDAFSQRSQQEWPRMSVSKFARVGTAYVRPVDKLGDEWD